MPKKPAVDLAIVAGSRKLPLDLLKAALEKNFRVLIIKVSQKEDTEILCRELKSSATFYEQVKVTQLGKLLKMLQSYQVSQLAFAGAINKAQIFDLLSFDRKALAILSETKSLDDDKILRAITAEVEALGIEVIAPDSLLAKNIVNAVGVFAGPKPEASDLSDLQYGYRIVRELGKLEIGQSAVFSGGITVCVEAVDGTDQNILRAGQIFNRNKRNIDRPQAVLIKLAKPQQDLRLDLPTIGEQTVRLAAANGISLIAVEVGKTIVLDYDQTIATANGLAVSLIAVDDKYLSESGQQGA